MLIVPTRAALVRCVPFAAFMLLLALRGLLPVDGALDARWLYAASVFIVGGLLAWYWREYGELVRQTLPNAGEAALAAVVGLVVFLLWTRLDAPWMQLAEPTASFVPIDANGALIWPLVALRWIGATLVVPVMEELFWRDFLWRQILAPNDFKLAAVGEWSLSALLIVSVAFATVHGNWWLTAIVWAMMVGGLLAYTKSLGACIIAHATTNLLLAVYVLVSQDWAFW